MLDVRNITKHFGKVTALDDVSVFVEEGETLALTGESGCGKSTLLRIISGLEQQDQGAVFFDGKDITRLKPEQRNFGFVFQNLALFPHLTVRQNILFAIKKAECSSKNPDRLTSMTGLSTLHDRYPHELSGGQQQRVALARALAMNPKLLMLDEPFSSLDERLKARIREDIFNLLKELNITTIMVSHQPTDAFLVADKLVMMKHGKVLQRGTPMSVYQQPLSPYIFDFFGAGVTIDGVAEEGQIHTSFGTLSTKWGNAPSCKVLLRPEHIELSNPKQGNLRGKVVKKQFKGSHDLLTIQAVNSAETFSFEITRCACKEGDAIYLRVSEDQLNVFTES